MRWPVREAQAANGTRERPLLLRRRCRQSDPDRLHPLREGPPELGSSKSGCSHGRHGSGACHPEANF